MKNRIFTLLISAFIGFLLISSCSKDKSSDLLFGEGIFTSIAGTAEIEGELFLPDGQDKFPLMIIVPGSGNDPRQELEQFVDIINSNGYALYLYDKRGVGNSTGGYPIETLETHNEFLTARAEDILGIIELLKTHNQIDIDKMGLFGSSQGAWVNSIVHSKSSDLSYIINTSGGVASTGLEGYYCSLTDNPNITVTEATQALGNFTGHNGFDPITIVENMALPALWIYGNEDRSHPARYDIEILEKLDKGNFTIQVYENTNHDLLDITTGQFPNDLFSNLGDWLDEIN